MGLRYYVQNGGIFIFPNTTVTNQMFQQELLPNQVLGKENKGRIDPIIPGDKSLRAGLGYF